MSDKKIFNDESKSRLTDLYANDVEKIIKQNASIDLYEQNISYANVQEAMSKQPTVETCDKSCLLDLDGFDFDGMRRSINCINAIPKSKETVSIEMCLVTKLPGIQFLHAGMVNCQGKAKYYPPRFLIDLSKYDNIKANQGVRINTGYIIKIPQIAMGKACVDNKIVNTKISSQLDTVIVPQIVSKHNGIIPTLYGRDAEDTGLLTINFTTTKDFDPKTSLQIVLNAYHCIRPVNSANIIGQENSTAVLFKPKDSRSGRWVKNPKIKYCADDFDLTTSPGSVLLKTYDNSKKPVELYVNQKIKITNIITLFTSRKREWFNPKLVTFAGVYNPNNGNKNSIPAMIANHSKIVNNTHGVVFIKSKIVIVSIDGQFSEDCRIVNGSFSNLKNYNDIVKRTRQITTALKGLSVGAKACQQIKAKHGKYDIQDLLRVYDYHRSINAEDPQLADKLKMPEDKLFESRPSTQNPYSANIYKCLKILAYNFCATLFTEKQLEELSLCCVGDESDDCSKIGGTMSDGKNGNLTNLPSTTITDDVNMSEMAEKRDVETNGNCNTIKNGNDISSPSASSSPTLSMASTCSQLSPSTPPPPSLPLSSSSSSSSSLIPQDADMVSAATPPTTVAVKRTASGAAVVATAAAAADTNNNMNSNDDANTNVGESKLSEASHENLQFKRAKLE